MALSREEWIGIGVVGAAAVGVLALSRRGMGESGAVTFLPVAPSEATSRAIIEAGVAFSEIESERQVGLAEIYTSGVVALSQIGAEERTRSRELSTAEAISSSVNELERFRIQASERVATRELEEQRRRNVFDFFTDILRTIGGFISL